MESNLNDITNASIEKYEETDVIIIIDDSPSPEISPHVDDENLKPLSDGDDQTRTTSGQSKSLNLSKTHDLPTPIGQQIKSSSLLNIRRRKMIARLEKLFYVSEM